MRNTFGNALTVTISGESHGKAITAVLDGIPAGEKISEEVIANRLALRRPRKEISDARVEDDRFEILGGVFDGYTTGTPITIVIPNESADSSVYNKNIIRPGHADYTAYLKYGEHRDWRGGGHFSGRVTVALVATGAIVSQILKRKGIFVFSHINSIGEITDYPITDPENDKKKLRNRYFPVLSKDAETYMKKLINEVRESGDSVGGIVETVVTGVPGGVGEPFFDSIESVISHAIFSVPGIKGIEFGSGFASAMACGSRMNDTPRFEGRKITFDTNNSGGINGGITNGMPITFNTAVRPTPTIARQQDTVDIEKGENIVYAGGGRHDACIVPRALHAINAVTEIAIYDMLLQKR